MSISRDVILKNKEISLKADVIEVNTKTRDRTNRKGEDGIYNTDIDVFEKNKLLPNSSIISPMTQCGFVCYT